ncbi:MAG TPA: cofactor-independent phosphoglycerate mutase [Thermodesulfovibrionales bacterium]|nr:cofactor-independent phosphoglycerate mutase [Thermodesulfovibrionales bacterium]
MKYIVIIGDGMADRPLKELDGKTPLQKALTPNMDRLAREGVIGSVRTIPRGMHPGSDVANLSILGYDPRLFYSGRAPLEAASMGVELDEGDVAYRCNLVTLKYDKQMRRAIMEDYSSGHISTGEAAILMEEINRGLGTETIRFYPGVSYRHLMVWRNGALDLECVPPHDILGKEIAEYLPTGEGEGVIRDIMMRSVGLLAGHPVNRKRTEEGKKPATSIWLWGQGRKPKMPTFREKYSLDGALVSAVDLTKGLGVCAGFEILEVPGVTGYIDTNYTGKAEYSLNALEKVDFVYIHVEAPDEAGHSGNWKDKIRAIEDFDSLVVGAVVKGAEVFGEYRVLLMPDHPTPIEARTHTDEPVPFVIYDSRTKRVNEGAMFDEFLRDRKEAMVVEEGYKLMDYFIKGE